MKYRIYYFIMIFVFLFSCKEKGGFQDISRITQAQKTLRVVRNAIEEYKIDNGHYPGQNSDLKAILAPYLTSYIYSEGKEIPKYRSIILSAKKNIDEIRSEISGCERIRDTLIEKVFYDTQKLIENYEKALDGEKIKISPLSENITKLYKLVEELRPSENKKLKEDSLVTEASLIIKITDSLIKINNNIHLQNIKNTFLWYKAELTKEKIEKKELFSPESEIDVLYQEKPPFDINLLRSAIENYRKLEEDKKYYEFLINTQKDLQHALNLTSIVEGKMKEAIEVAPIVQAQISLHSMADALKDYKREKGVFPEEDVNIDSILHPYFIETMISGEKIDRWFDKIKWFSRGPIYKKTKEGFRLEAYVNGTQLISEIKLKNKWDDLMKSFAGPIIYTTPDSNVTYFIKARAKDSELIWVTDRPPTKIGEGVSP